MYQLAFNHRAFYSCYGVYYDELTSVGLRLDHELTDKLVQTGSNFEGCSRLVSCHTVCDPSYQPPATQTREESFDEGIDCLGLRDKTLL